jgi:DNA-binding transcriptional ArsR family regulator
MRYYNCEALLAKKDSKTTGKSIEETRQYHTRYLRAINNPLRREILRALKKGNATIEDLHLSTGLNEDTLKWHLNILEYGFCVDKEINQGKLIYRLTQEGRVVDYLG